MKRLFLTTIACLITIVVGAQQVADLERTM